VVSSVLAVDPYLYTASWDKTIRQWNLATGECQLFAALDKEVLCLLEHKDKIIAGCRDSQIRVYTKLTREEVKDQKMIKHKEAVNSLTAIAGNASLTIFSASNDNRCVQWEMTSSSWGDVDAGAGADPSLSAALAERIAGSSGVQKAANVKSSILAQNQLDDSLPKVVKGWLWKQGRVFQRWSKRFYTLDKGLMLYYTDDQYDSSKPLGHLNMHDLISAAPDDSGVNRGRSHCFTLVTLDRTIHLSAEPEELREWLTSLKKYVENNNLQKKIEQKRDTRKY